MNPNMDNDLPAFHWRALSSKFPSSDPRIRQLLLDPYASNSLSLPTATAEWSSLDIRRLGFGSYGRVLQVNISGFIKMVLLMLIGFNDLQRWPNVVRTKIYTCAKWHELANCAGNL
jgi:hypothetical protein